MHTRCALVAHEPVVVAADRGLLASAPRADITQRQVEKLKILGVGISASNQRQARHFSPEPRWSQPTRRGQPPPAFVGRVQDQHGVVNDGIATTGAVDAADCCALRAMVDRLWL